jgi:hypothetical protein
LPESIIEMSPSGGAASVGGRPPLLLPLPPPLPPPLLPLLLPPLLPLLPLPPLLEPWLPVVDPEEPQAAMRTALTNAARAREVRIDEPPRGLSLCG